MTNDAGSGAKTLAEVEAGQLPLRAAEVRVTCRAEVTDSQPDAEVTYVLTDGADWLRVETTFTNNGDKDRELVMNANNSIVHYLQEGSERLALAPGQSVPLVRQIAPAPHRLALQTRAGKLLAAGQEPLTRNATEGVPYRRSRPTCL